MSESGVVVIGAGGHGVVVASALVASGVHVAAFYDDDPRLWGHDVEGAPVIGPVSESKSSDRRAIVAIGDNAVRKRVVHGLDLDWITVIHPFSWVAPGVEVDRGSFIGAGTVIQPRSVIGSHVILSGRAGLGHDAQVASFAHLSVAYLGSSARVGEGALLAIGSSVLPGVDVGSWAVVGAGALVTRDVAPGSTVVGIPARPMPPDAEPRDGAIGPAPDL